MNVPRKFIATGEAPADFAGDSSAPTAPRGSADTPADLDFHASGFVVGVEGVWSNAALAQFREFLRVRHLSPTDEELQRSLQRARTEYLESEHRLFLCGANPCCRALGFNASELALASASRMAGLPVSKTGCQGQCKHAPVLSLRIGEQCQMLARVVTVDDWLAALTFVRTAVRGDSLLVSPGDAEPFLHDPVHDHGKPDARLNPLRFLLGHFRGEGRFAMNGYVFQKEVVGSCEAGGRFIALRMASSYPLADGRKDTHRALVIVGPEPSSDGITGRAYTDGGHTREYAVEQHEQSLRFADTSPDHSRRWKRSQKLLLPTNDGFEERLEVDAGDGFVPYYSIAMRRRAF